MGVITFSCGKCHQVLKVGSDKAGRKAKCPKCGNPLQVPNVPDAAPAPAPAARPPAPRPAAPARPVRPPVDQVDVVDEVVEMEEVQEMPPRPAPRRGKNSEGPEAVYQGRPRSRRPPDDEDDYDDDRPPRRGQEEDYDEDDDRPRKKKKKVSARQLWPKVGVGFLILIITTCIFGGALGLRMIADIIKAIGFMGAGGGAQGYVVLMRISVILALLAGIGSLVGYVFSFFAPNKNGTLPLIIATTVSGVGFIVLCLICEVLPLLGEGGNLELVLTFLIGAPTGGSLVLFIFLHLAFGAMLILFALFLQAVAIQIKEGGLARDCVSLIILASVWAGVLILAEILGMVAVKNGSKAVLWIRVILDWIGHICRQFSITGGPNQVRTCVR